MRNVMESARRVKILLGMAGLALAAVALVFVGIANAVTYLFGK
jgi:hypothetical protein